MPRSLKRRRACGLDFLCLLFFFKWTCFHLRACAWCLWNFQPSTNTFKHPMTPKSWIAHVINSMICMLECCDSELEDFRVIWMLKKKAPSFSLNLRAERCRSMFSLSTSVATLLCRAEALQFVFCCTLSTVVRLCVVSLFSVFFQAPQSPLTQPPPSLSLRLPRFTRVQAHSPCPLSASPRYLHLPSALPKMVHLS